MIRAVLFDLDGTLLNRNLSLRKFIEDQHIRLNLKHIPIDQYISRFIKLDQHGYVWKDKVYAKLIEELKIKDLTASQLLKDYLSFFPRHCTPFDNLEKMLVTIKQQNIKLGMISNGFSQFQMDNIKALKIDHYFDTILISEYEGIKKPDREIFMRGLSKLGVSPKESIFVGDHPVNDIEAAKKAGMKTIWKKNTHFSHAPAADYCVTDLFEIIDIIEREKGKEV
ncbi:MULTISPECIES: HAD family hydrolase [Bacillaceae]|uniref:HAD family hydrolase n=1 Tax=Bacillaceae TaxID=186817 RepID=UPI000BFE70E5|nr:MULTISPECIES: HAD family hydrolase [Bacillaceae]PGT90400.1 L-2-haloalkanoic acid dehalogenase [Bacillus sp. AFS040349]UGB31580.1 HAD family hydrolase [Metabacillus sp. B2-18]